MSRNIVLVAHDSRKSELLEWVKTNSTELLNYNLFGTGTTATLLENIEVNGAFPFKGKVTHFLSGPLGGDQQIGASIANGDVDALLFFCDNLITQGHQADISALSRLASLYNIAFATNRTTADMILHSPLFNDDSYKRIIPPVIKNSANRKL